MLRLLPRGLASTGATPSWEDLGGVFVPGAAPVGWLAVVRPDRTILIDGPASEASRIVREALGLLGAPSAMAEPASVPTQLRRAA